MCRGRRARVVTQVHFILGGELVRRCWVQQLEAAESNADRLCRVPDSAPRDKVRTWHDSFEACARDVSSLQRAGASPPLSYSTHVRVGSLAGWLATYYSVYRREHVLPRRVNCSGEDRKLSVPFVILSGTSAEFRTSFKADESSPIMPATSHRSSLV